VAYAVIFREPGLRPDFLQGCLARLYVFSTQNTRKKGWWSKIYYLEL